MVRLLGSLIFCLLLSTQAWATSFNASVDRKTISEQDTFTLILRYGGQAGFSSPDVSALKKDFHILNQQQSRKMTTINGQMESYTDWVLTLTPQRTGQLTIPSIEYDDEKTDPITVQVNAVSDDVKAQQEKEFFFDISVQKQPQYYVQQQILYTEKVYYSVQHDEPSLTSLDVTDARVEPLGDVRQYTTVIKGQRFGVYERNFAIYPEVSGELVIPGQRFQASVRDPYDRWGRGRQASIVSKPISLTVNSIPAGYPQAPWLPASQLSISERFSADPQDWQQGDPITRTITLKATGLPGNQLPPVPVPEIRNIRYYPDQTESSDDLSENGVEGTSVQSMALVPAASGKITLPEIRIPWWNVTKGQLEYAGLPAHTVTVAPAQNAAQNSGQNTVNGNTQSAAEASASDSHSGNSNGGTLVSADSHFSGFWPVLFALSLLVNIVLGWLLLKKPAAAMESAESDALQNEKQCWKALNTACRNGDAKDLHSALLKWANAALRNNLDGSESSKDRAITSLPQLAARYRDPALNSALSELDALLFSAQGNSAYNGQNLLSLLKARKQLDEEKPQNDSLYPA